MIEELTPEQTELIEVVKNKWLDAVFKEPKVNKEAIDSFIKQIYRIAELQEPEVLIFPSPLAAQIAANLLIDGQDTPENRRTVEELSAGNLKEVKNKILESSQPAPFNWHTTSYFGDVSDFAWAACVDFWKQIGVEFDIEALAYVENLFEARPLLSICHERICFVSLLPTSIKRDSEQRLHSLEGPAMEFSDGYKLFYIDGVFFTPQLHKQIKEKSLPVKEMLSLENIEQRMIALKYIGVESLLESDSCKLVDSSPRGNELFKIEGVFPETAYYLRYKDPSTDRVYMSGVDPAVAINHNADEAMSWKLSLTAEEYANLVNEA